MSRLCRSISYFRKLLNNSLQLNQSYQRCIHKHSVIMNKSYDELNKSAKVPVRYEIFREETSPVILDVEEEKRRMEAGVMTEEEIDVPDPFEGISPERGTTGVIEVEELVEILQQEHGDNIFVAAVPKEYQYVDYIVVVSGKSVRHMQAMAEFVRRVYKYKRGPKDWVPKLEGGNSREWMALDMGNIALHIFAPHIRSLYDLESLWSVGREYDSLYNAPDDPLVTFMKEFPLSLKDLTPAEPKT